MITTPSLSDVKFSKDLTGTLDKESMKCDDIIVLGDLNYKMLSAEKLGPLQQY